MNDPADRWDSPLSAKHESTDPPIPAFFRALTSADEKIAELAQLRTRLNSADAVPEWKPLAEGMALLIDRYYGMAAGCDQEAAITNLASLLRHASAFSAALCREVEHYATDARDAREQARDLQDRLVDLAEDNVRLKDSLLRAGIEAEA